MPPGGDPLVKSSGGPLSPELRVPAARPRTSVTARQGARSKLCHRKGAKRIPLSSAGCFFLARLSDGHRQALAGVLAPSSRHFELQGPEGPKLFQFFKFTDSLDKSNLKLPRRVGVAWA